MKKYIFGAVFTLGILLAPVASQAAALTNQQVQSILSLLNAFGADQSVIDNVNASLTGSAPTTTGKSCYTFRNNLTVGSSGADVIGLNQALSSLGINTTGNTSVFDENLAGDVVTFQATYGIKQTGYVGPLTRAKLNALYGCSAQPTPTPVPTQSISVLYPTSGMSFSQGQPMTISWQAISPNAIYTLGYFASGGEGKGAIGQVMASEAHCSAADKCYISWTPAFSSSNVTISVAVPASGYSGSSGSFTIVASTTTAGGPTISFLSTPTLVLQYDSASGAVGKEANLVASATVRVTTGSVSLNPNNLAYIIQLYRNGYGGASSNSMTRNVTSSIGGTVIPANSSATFTITVTAPTRELFAGAYSLALSNLAYADANNVYQSLEPSSYLNISTNATNGYGQINGVPNVVIVGETSPYISSITTDSSGNVTITGVRFDSTSNAVLFNGAGGPNLPSSNNGTTIVVPKNTSGTYCVQVNSSTTGASNVYCGVTISGISSAPTVTFLSTPTLSLQHDSVGNETNLVGSATVRVTTGSTSLDPNNLQAILYLYRNGYGGQTSNSMTRSVTGSIGGTVIPANTTATFTITVSAPTKELFAGAYTLMLSGFSYVDSTNTSQTAPYSSFIGISTNGTTGQVGNTVVIIGETAPYITSAVSDSSGNIIITGVRFHSTSNSVSVGSKTVILPSSNNGTQIIVPNNAAGGYTVQVTHPTTGASNGLYVTVNGISTAPTLSPIPTIGSCSVSDVYAVAVPGFTYYNVYMAVNNLPSSGEPTIATNVVITGADSWNNLVFALDGSYTASGQTILKATQTVNATGVSYILARKNAIRPISNGTKTFSCASISGLVADASANQNQLASALSAFSSAAAAQPAFSYVWNHDLQIGSPYFDDVIALQTALTHEGLYSSEITGGFYNQTFAAVKAFQMKYGFDVTGFVGPVTRAKLNAIYVK